MLKTRRIVAGVGLACFAILTALLLTREHPRRTVLHLTDEVAAIGHGAMSLAPPARLAVVVAVAFAVLVPLFAALPTRPRPGMAALVTTAAAAAGASGLWFDRDRGDVVDFTAAALLGTLIGWLIAAGLHSVDSRRSTRRGLRRSATALLTSFFVAAGFIGFWHDPIDSGSRLGLLNALTALRGLGAPSWLDYGFVEIAANVVFFLPLGLLLTLVLPPHRWWVAVAVGCVMSACIELGQAMLLPTRTASWDDFAANSAGSLLGSFIATVATASSTRRRRRGRLHPSGLAHSCDGDAPW